MCLAIPGKVKKILDRQTLVEYPSESRLVLTGGIPVKIGDYVLVQMGIIIKKISKTEAGSILRVWKELKVTQ
jgi:hydrogenase assembly chaperone HypC/HupF